MRKRNISAAVITMLLFLVSNANLMAKEVIGLPNSTGSKKKVQRRAAACEPATFQADLDINNVRARILNGGDMWWDLNSVARYEIPKTSSESNAIRKNSLFAGAIWIGGLDPGGNLKVAAMTYRQGGSDYFPGPLDSVSATTEAGRCKFYDRIYKINQPDIAAVFKDINDATDDIINYPGSGDVAFKEARNIAPFFDANGDGVYSYDAGDYPVLDPLRPRDRNTPEDQPDQMLTFVYNDRGNIHSETSGIPIGLELVTTAFAFKTNDEINNMTFYKTKITNRSNDGVRDCYFGQWVDADLGNFSDDYVGCDTTRDLGFCYNGDDDDEGILGYGTNPPSVGTDFFEGPKDENGNELGLAKFVYYNNDFSVIGNPTLAEHYYGYLRGIWKDGSPVTFGGNGYNTGSRTDFMFPDDPSEATGWHEKSAGNTPGDRRYIQSSGPFTLEPGAVNYVTVGVVWARATTGGATGSLGLLRLASDKAQKLFNNNFDIIDGPDAPTVLTNELDREVVFTFTETNTPRVEKYREIITGSFNQNLEYRFQGYVVYQLANAEVTAADLENVDNARVVFQCDVKDDVSQIINQEFDDKVGVPIPREKVNGANEGIVHSFKITEDLFASSDKRLVNFKTYYYLVISYANLTNDPNEDEQYLGGRFTSESIRVIPHKPDPRGTGTEIGAGYGDGPVITRISGRGNGGQVLELTEETEKEILNSPDNKVALVDYKGGAGPVNLKVVDPFKIVAGQYELRLLDSTFLNSARTDSISNSERTNWMLVNTTTNDTAVFSDTTIGVVNEQVIPKWGISLTINQVAGPGDPNNLQDNSNGFLEATMTFANNEKPWLTGLADDDAFSTSPAFSWFNWIRAGRNGSPTFSDQPFTHDFAINGVEIDPREKWEDMLDGRIAPYALAARAPANAQGRTTFGPAYSQQPLTDNPLSELASVDIVITPDKTKWSKCAVVEMSEDAALSIGNAEKFQLRRSPSVDKNFQPLNNGEQGRSWFPGYAINVETGERLNIIFGEDSNLPNENGTDMIWNPTENTFSSQGSVLGGKHYFYIMGSYRAVNYVGPIYDEGDAYLPLLNSTSVLNRRRVFSQAMYVMPALAETGVNFNSGVPPYEVRIRIRAQKPYQNYNATNDTTKNKNIPFYSFNTDDIVANDNSESAKKSTLDLIGVVPNPYYAFSEYEGSRLDNRIKFINLPQKTTIKIFTFSGTLVRTIKKDDEQTFVEWDLKNQANVPIASGMYIVHVDAEGVGTKVLKWFGIMRQIDLDTF